jgi:gamma-glutamylputrescine oxidase
MATAQFTSLPPPPPLPHSADSRFACDYYRPLADGRILWGGRIDVTGIRPDRLAGVLHGDMVKVYPQLADVRVEVAWPGVMGYAAHKMPLIGRLPGMEGVWYCTGFGGHGVCPTTVAGDLVATAIARGDQRWQLFKPFGLRWAGGPYLGAAAAQAFYWAYEARDWWNELRINRRVQLQGPRGQA